MKSVNGLKAWQIRREEITTSANMALKVVGSHSIVRQEEKEPVRNRRGPNHCHESRLHFPWVVER